MWKAAEGSTRQLVQFCLAYFATYVITGVSVKYYLGSPAQGFPGYHDIEFLVYGTVSATLLPLLIVLILRWYRMESVRRIAFLGMRLPVEYLFIIPSGVCTAVVVPTTTLMYTLPIPIMVAMIIMRGSVIIISRIVDAIQLRQGILKKEVYPNENWAVAFAVAAVSVPMFWNGQGGFGFLHNPAAMSILGSYVSAYALRIYIMNYYKNTTGKGAKRDNKAFFAVEQIAMYVTLLITVPILFYSPTLFEWNFPQIEIFRQAVLEPRAGWLLASFWGAFFGVAAFFSVFLFMFKGRTATFAGLVNRLTSLIAGTAATLLFHFAFGGKFPKTADWISLLLILIAVGFLTQAERRRSRELLSRHELELTNPGEEDKGPLRAPA